MNDTVEVAGETMRRTNVRYLVLVMIFIITSLNYADRASLSITASTMRAEFGINAIKMGYIFSAFGLTYVLAQLPSGWLLDRFGARRVYALSLFFWSLFTLLQGGVGVVGGAAAVIPALIALRCLVGLAEAPAFPANAKVVASWFPASERGTASAVVTSATYFAAAVFTPAMAWLTHMSGWRNVYLCFGVGGMLLALLWLKLMRDPVAHPRVNLAELEHISRGGGLIDAKAQKTAEHRGIKTTVGIVCQLMSRRMLLGIYLGQYCVNVLLYFFLTWFPIYLVQSRGMSILQAGIVTILPAVFGFAGGVAGGAFSDMLLRKGHSLTFARKLPIIAGMVLSMSMIVCNYVSADAAIVALMILSYFGKGFGGLGWAVISDVAPKEAVGVLGAIFNTFGNIAGIVTPIVIGYIVETTKSFNGALIFVSANALVAILSYAIIVKDIRRVNLKLS